ncbi:hypothetical protein QP400_06400 [Winkia sp. UMB3158]|uniref:Resolvase HTH domain-containing protein n=1 Tax=Winkia neuii BV029A5 TaxID=888439 RepID=K0YPE5_9ACTO|nr:MULTISPECIES: hypothetical protein [Winkia]MDK6230680.1 hypothetical protein [Streptococcus agalactiae]MDK8340979.1 hypothetical protein [Winkia sp. UMB3164B]OFJ72376.1 hypothetical protein HMPREF2851_05495 [Actinomyces sp. HMSC064C12]OFK00049.1 hypothetical protein HMPREF2835_03595 [Actinomyces sp. HMSC072A03]OFT40089.1 hypothetical protein HMPREF3163_01725 [Actinomyces sp. HMSC08A01]
MDEKAKRELLAEVRKTAKGLSLAKSARKEAVMAALEAEVPRQEIADALQMHRNSIYRIISED